MRLWILSILSLAVLQYCTFDWVRSDSPIPADPEIQQDVPSQTVHVVHRQTIKKAIPENVAFEYKVGYVEPSPGEYLFSYNAALPRRAASVGLPLYEIDAVDTDQIFAAAAAMHRSGDVYTYIESYTDPETRGKTEELTHALAIELYRFGIPIERIKRREKLVGDRNYVYVALAAIGDIW